MHLLLGNRYIVSELFRDLAFGIEYIGIIQKYGRSLYHLPVKEADTCCKSFPTISPAPVSQARVVRLAVIGGLGPVAGPDRSSG